MVDVRLPAVAGSFYPAAADELKKLISQCAEASPLGPKAVKIPSVSLIAGMVPHAGYVYSGACAAHFYSRMPQRINRVIILGINHRGIGHHASLSPWFRWRTPLGETAVDRELNDFLAARVTFLKYDAASHTQEHSIEVQLPFLQSVLEDFTFVPIALSHLSVKECAELGGAIAAAWRTCSSAANTIMLSSTDLSHYLPPAETDALDALVLEQVLAMDPRRLLKVVEEKEITMCGALPTAVLLYALNELGVNQADLLKHYHSGDVQPMHRVVGYASVAFEQ